MYRDYTERHFRDLSLCEQLQLRRLTLNPVRGILGFGTSALAHWAYHPPQDDRICVASHNSKFIGWAVRGVAPHFRTVHSDTLQVYVHPSFRRQGVGRVLVSKAMHLWGPLPGIIWSPTSESFYSRLITQRILRYAYNVQNRTSQSPLVSRQSLA